MPTSAETHILVVDDDASVRLLLRRCYESEGWTVSEAATRADAQRILASGRVRLVTLDLMLNGDDGLTFAREIRRTSAVPIIIVSGKGDTIDRVVGLEIGADDYIAKPFHVREVLARTRAVLRRTEHAEKTTVPRESSEREAYGFGGYVLDLTRRELKGPGGDLVALTTAEFSLLEVFVRNANRVLSRDRIMDLLKGQEWSPYDRTIDNQVARLRKKIERDPDQPLLIKTVRGIGYTLTADVVCVR